MSDRKWHKLAEELAVEALEWQDKAIEEDNAYLVGIGNGIKYAAKEIAKTIKLSNLTHAGRRD